MKKLIPLFVLCLSFIVPSISSAINVDYTLTSLGGSNYRYDYAVTNDGTDTVKLFDIAFDPALYLESSLVVVSASYISADWQEDIFASAPGIPAVYNVFALSGGIPGGVTQAGFAVEFEWLSAAAAPGQQLFEVYDPETFDLLATSMTSSGISAVPEPSSILLLYAALTGLVTFSRRWSRL